MGFLKFLFAIIMVLGGLFLTAVGFFSCATVSIFGNGASSAPSWIIGVIGILIFLGGIYMFRSGKA